MSRPIKFRAFDKKNKWWDAGPFWIDDNGKPWEEPNRKYDTPNQEIESTDNLIIMQWTGLLDKNGKPIFEGDIVREAFKHIPDELVGKIVYIETHAAFAIDYGDDTLLFSDENILEVIGNIHET